MAAVAAAPDLRPAEPTSELPCGTARDAVRAFGVVFGGSVALDLGAVASFATAARALARRRRPPAAALAGIGATVAYATAAVPWMRHWGSTPDERVRRLPGDELVPDARIVTTRAVLIEAPVDHVWPWLAQIGQDRGGFYSYTRLENLAGCRMHNADLVHDEWQQRRVGELVPLHPAHGLPLAHFEPGRALVLQHWGAFVLEPLSATRTVLIARGRVPRGAAALFHTLLVELPHFVMERRMLLGIKERAEAAVAPQRAFGAR